MAIKIPVAVKASLDKLLSEYSILYCLKMEKDGNVLRYCNNIEKVNLFGEEYTPLPFTVSGIQDSLDGSFGSLNISMNIVPNSTVVQGYLETEGFVDWTISITPVFIKVTDNTLLDLGDAYKAMTYIFSVTSSVISSKSISIDCKVNFNLTGKFPTRYYWPLKCAWNFKSAECGYSGTATECNKTWESCVALNNVKNFGGFPGLHEDRVRVV
jgi:phage-related protein